MDKSQASSASPKSRPKPKNPDDVVADRVRELRFSTYLNPVVDKFFREPGHKEIFYEVFARQANLIKSRCQDFEDGYVSIFDKVLLELTDNGNVFDSVPAQEYFCEEYLGISKDGVPIVAERILSQNILFKAFIAQGKSSSSSSSSSSSLNTRPLRNFHNEF
jgi:hypothetical protein